MKKTLVIMIVIIMALGMFAGCSSNAPAETDNAAQTSTEAMSGSIMIYSREEGSGTRGAFIELFGIEQKDADGNKVDYTTEDAEITNSTSVMMTSVAGNVSGIGYISLGSLNDTVKALPIDGAEATVDNIKSGAYKISRPFNIVTKDSVSEAAQAFIDFIMSAEGQTVIEGKGYIPLDNVKPFAGSAVSGKVVVAGSSSVTPIMEKLKEAYLALNPNAEIEIQQSDSSTGISMAIEGTCDIGMASRALKDTETGVTATVIATDGIAVIANNDNTISGITSEQVMGIYTGEITDWSEITE